MFRQGSEWVPFDDMYEHMRRGVTQAVLQPSRTPEDVQAYLVRRAADLQKQYALERQSDSSMGQHMVAARYYELQRLAEYLNTPLPDLE